MMTSDVNFINGIKMVGAQPYDAFRQVIDKELANE